MPEWLSCTLWSGGIGLVAGVLCALLHEWWAIRPLRRRCWRAALTLAQLRATPEGRACLAHHAALTDREDDA